MEQKLTDLPNIGKELARQLNEVGIYNYDDLVDRGSEEAWLAIKEIDSSACYNRLCALEGALQGIRWHDLRENDKNRLKDFYSANKTAPDDMIY
ncbi:MAG: TfoX/Sxy family protein [Lactobacillales bacterium]|jgi:DNA transformation protein|nr:TfoX/Sxy family protein [Lactobacillales bacterium]